MIEHMETQNQPIEEPELITKPETSVSAETSLEVIPCFETPDQSTQDESINETRKDETPINDTAINETTINDGIKSKDKEFSFDAFKNRIERSYKQISISRKMKKFFNRPYLLFNRFDSGVLMDTESWYSVTPEAVAAHIANKCFTQLGQNSSLVVLDAFCGAGGNTIQFARLFDHVVACDIDSERLQCAQHNAAHVYELGHKVSFVQQDFFKLHQTLAGRFDVIFLSPPWGGVNYYQAREADVSEFPLDCFKIFTYCTQMLKCANVVFFMPRNVCLEQVMCMAGPGGFLELEQNFLDHKLVAVSLYYGDMCDKSLLVST
jgi:trimethylguanosine synthase